MRKIELTRRIHHNADPTIYLHEFRHQTYRHQTQNRQPSMTSKVELIFEADALSAPQQIFFASFSVISTSRDTIVI